MKLNKKTIQAYIINAIDTEGFELPIEPKTEAEKLSFVAEQFRHWLCLYDFKRCGSNYQNAFADWLMGLPSSFNIDFENYKIIEIGEKWGSFDGYPIGSKQREKREDFIISNWFNLIAANTLQMFNKYGIEYTKNF